MIAIVLVVLLAVGVGWHLRGYRDSLRLTPAIKRTAARKPATLDRQTRQRLARDERLGLAVGYKNVRKAGSP